MGSQNNRNILFSKVNPVYQFKHNWINYTSIVVLAIVYIFNVLPLKFFIAILILILLLNWKEINILFYFIFSSFFSKTVFFIAYFQDKDKKEIPYYNTSSSLKEESENHYSSLEKSQKYYYLGLLETEDKNHIIDLLRFKNTFQDENNLTVFFTMSLFLMNIIYSIMMLIIYSIEVLHQKELLIVLTTSLFAVAIYFFLKETSPMSILIKEYNNDKDFFIRLGEVEIWEYYKDKSLNYNIQDIEDFFLDINAKLNDKKSSVLQIATPIFYLAYITILLSYFSTK